MGCQSDEKQLNKMVKLIEESAPFEKDFAANQKKLDEARKNAQSVYLDLINLNYDDKDLITQKINEANTYREEQEKRLAEAEENFQKAYETTVAIEKPMKKIKNEDQKKQVFELVVMMNERKRLIEDFFEAYHETLEWENSFYQQLADGKYPLEDLDQQIHKINKHNQDMEEMIHQFNQFTEKYNEGINDFL